ncbi:MAG TPA: transcription termination/antitermination protein NusA, partial [Acidimicrobiia bacterium]|nr:transcription termination/antitermination protein NusA [Acidimicrobiia bacterium]
VVVHDYQLSLAIGKEGQNARLAARLTGWRIDIKSETQLAEEEAGYAGEEWAEGEWVTDAASGELVWQPAEGGEAMSAEQWSHGGEDSEEKPPAAAAVEVEAAVQEEEQAEGAEAAEAETEESAEEAPA